MYVNKKNRFTGKRQFIKGNARRKSLDYSRFIEKEVRSETVLNPEINRKFWDFPIHEQIRKNISDRGYEIPTPIQDRSFTPIFEGRDIIGIANTGTGKTAAFLIPLVNKILNRRSDKIIIITPTRELAVQIDDEFKMISKNLSIQSLLCIGGASMNMQISALRQNVPVVIGTPGRLKDLLERKILNLSGFNNVVLDEVDRMVDIGFIKDIRLIISLLPKPRQSLFFSATVSTEVKSIIESFVTNPVTVSVKQEGVAPRIHQEIIKVKDKEEKIVRLKDMLRQTEFRKVLIFGRTKWGVEKLSLKLQKQGFNADSIHGNKSLNQRLRVLNKFRENQLRILVATDVVARGIDIEDISHVINFDEPASHTDYIHRIGRTGRAEKLGKALTFVG